MKILRLMITIAVLCLTAGASTALAQKAKDSGDRHPSYNLIGRDAQSVESPLNSNFVMADEARLKEGGFWRSSFLTSRLVGLTVTDIDGDGRNELIYATIKGVYVARIEGQKLAQLANYEVETGERLSTVDVYDANGDGRPEIFACIQSDSIKGGTLILHYESGTLTRAVERPVPWYLRVVNGPGGRMLAGQKPAVSGDDVFSGGVFKMSFDGNSVKSQGRIDLPTGGNVFNFTFGRLGASNKSMSVVVKWPSEHLFLYEGKDRAWESREEYAGTMNVLDPPVSTASNAAATPRRVFIPARLLLFDIDRDGQNELIVAKNDRGGVPFMSGLRAFTGGIIQIFKYSNLSLRPFYRTQPLPGPAVDYALADFNNNGTLDLVAAVVMEQESGMMKDGRSVIMAYEIFGSEPGASK